MFDWEKFFIINLSLFYFSPEIPRGYTRPFMGNFFIRKFNLKRFYSWNENKLFIFIEKKFHVFTGGNSWKYFEPGITLTTWW